MLIQANGFDIEIKQEKDLHMDGKYIVIYFEDPYQLSLVEHYKWDEKIAENEVDKVFERELQKAGFECSVIWEDREVFLIEAPEFSPKNVAKVFISIFPDAREKKQNIISKLFQKD